MLKGYLGLPISTRYNGNVIIIEYDDKFQRTKLSTLESNMLYECFLKVCKSYNIKSEYSFIGSIYKYEYTEKVTTEMFNEFNVNFFDSMDKKLEKMLELVFEAMDLQIIKYLTSCDGRRLNVLKYFAEFEEIPDIKMFYKYGIIDCYDFIVTEFRSIDDTEKYQIVDLSTAKIKKYTNLKNKGILKLNGSIVKRFLNFDEAFNYMKDKIQLVKQ